MRLSEITKDNVNWAILSDLSLDLVDDAQDTLDALHVLIQSQSPSRNRAMLPFIEKVEQGLRMILECSFPDEHDPDVVELKKTIEPYLRSISVLKSKLKL
jgi:hypothetical protein